MSQSSSDSILPYFVYVVTENGDVYPDVYLAYEDAVAAVKDRHWAQLEEEMNHASDWCPPVSEVDVPESDSGTTELYIEKGIYIQICKRPILY